MEILISLIIGLFLLSFLLDNIEYHLRLKLSRIQREKNQNKINDLIDSL